jgi:type IV fimbrial biogenesis protein FimT
MKKYNGFTLIELLITLVIVSILLTIGVPAMKTYMQSGQLIASTNELLSAFHLARSESVKSNARVTICTSTNGTSCSGSESWREGWIVFIDRNGDTAGTGTACTVAGTAGGDCLLRVHNGFTDSSLSVSGEDSNSAAITDFTFSARGLPTVGGISRSGTFSICSFDTSDNVIGSRAVVLSLSGRVRISDNAAVIDCPAAPPA